MTSMALDWSRHVRAQRRGQDGAEHLAPVLVTPFIRVNLSRKLAVLHSPANA